MEETEPSLKRKVHERFVRKTILRASALWAGLPELTRADALTVPTYFGERNE